MEVIIKKDYGEISREAALLISEGIRRGAKSGGSYRLGLATGSTPVGLYGELIRMRKEEGLDFSGVVTFNLDEYVGLPFEHPQSYHRFMSDNLFGGLNVKPENIHLPDGLAEDIESHCLEYERAIRDSGGIDLQVLGIGRDGHIGFNEPGSSLASRTRIKTLAPETIKDNARFFAGEGEVPRYAVTMGVGTILEAKRFVVLVSGKAKAEAVAGMVEGPVTAEITASALQLHPYVIVICDESAASGLKRRDYYRYVYEAARRLRGARV